MVDESGTTVWQASYDAFGKATVTTSTISNNLRFPGQYADEETGNHYNWNRYYDPGTGRYTQEDPIGLKGEDLNYYRYVRNRATYFIDPWGLASSTTMPLPYPKPITLPSLPSAVPITRLVNPVSAFITVLLWDGNPAGPEDDMIPPSMLRPVYKKKHKPNRTGSTPNYRNPAKNKGGKQCSYKGPNQDPDWNPFLPYLIPFVTQVPKGQEMLNHAPDFIDAWMPGTTPAPMSKGGIHGWETKTSFDFGTTVGNWLNSHIER